MSGKSQIFKRNGEPLRFYLVRGATYVSEEGGLGRVEAEELRMKIQAHGGQVMQDIDAAHIWIVGKDVLKTYQEYCMSDPDHRAEAPAFIHKSIRLKGVPAEAAVEKKPMHGRYPGKVRFTEDDDELLCQWLAIKTPNRESGGRKGNKMYQQLVELAAKYPNGRWAGAKSHPWQSWRERYRKRADHFDARIEEIAAAARLTAESRTAYPNDRRVNKRVAARVIQDEEDQGGLSVSEDEEQGEFSSSDIEVGVEEQRGFSVSDVSEDDVKVRHAKRRRSSVGEEDVRPAKRRSTDTSSLSAGPSRAASRSFQAKGNTAPLDTQRTLVGSRAPSRAVSVLSNEVDFDLTLDSDSDA